MVRHEFYSIRNKANPEKAENDMPTTLESLFQVASKQKSLPEELWNALLNHLPSKGAFYHDIHGVFEAGLWRALWKVFPRESLTRCSFRKCRTCDCT
uniref:Uncharacterized protein n=1 Tax=Magallana gigas TaxID=29159 RepID=K1RDK6_MAGGI